MSTDKSAAAIMEFCQEWCGLWDKTNSYLKPGANFPINHMISDLTALISEHYYPKEYLMWIFQGCPFLIGENGAGKIIAFSVKDGKQYTPDELYQYWKKREQ